jgi:hypothetical protein
MKRFKFLLGQRRFQVLATMAVLLLAVSVVYASGANFNATSANAGNIFTAGKLTMTNTGALLNLSGLKPDGVWLSEGSVTLTNTGDLTGHFTMASVISADTAGTGHTAKLSTALQIRIHDHAAAPGVYILPATAINAIGTVDLLNWAPAANHQYDFEVMFPNGGTPGGADLGDNTFQGSTMTIAFNWTATSL